MICIQLVLSTPDRGNPGWSTGRGYCSMFLGKTLNSHSASLHPDDKTITGEFKAGGNPAMD